MFKDEEDVVRKGNTKGIVEASKLRAIKDKITHNPVNHEKRTSGFHVECC